MMGKNEEMIRLTAKVKDLFEERRGAFFPDDFVEVADLMGFHAYEKVGPDKQLKPMAENYLPDIISTNLKDAVETYEWRTHLPMTDDGIIIAGFWDRRKEALPEGYELEIGGCFLKRKG